MATLEKPKLYPQTNALVLTILPQLPHTKPKVFEHFRNYTQLSPQDARNILIAGFHPVIKVKHTGAQYGWTPPTADEIWLHDGFIDQIESLMSGRSEVVSGYYNHYDTQKYAKEVLMPKLRLLLEVTIMHELVHYGRRIVHGYNPNRRQEELIAQAFEKDAYGKVHTATSLGITDVVAEPR